MVKNPFVKGKREGVKGGTARRDAMRDTAISSSVKMESRKKKGKGGAEEDGPALLHIMTC